ncbi:hypothetical protein BDW67DRAFT_175726 [Aspergillus spinulosporus]
MARLVRDFAPEALQGRFGRVSSSLFLTPSFTSFSPSRSPNNKAISTRAVDIEIEPYKYTSGRRLRRDDLEIERLQQGLQIYLGQRQGNRGKIPFQLAGPARLTTLSEVATIRYLQAKTSIPIPKILDWNHNCSNINNTVGCKYIIMEHANSQVRCIHAIYWTIKELVDLEFPAHVSIHFDNALDSVGKQLLGDGICIGLYCGTRYWGCDAGERRYYHYARQNYGPYPSALSIEDDCDGLVGSGLSRVPREDVETEKRPIYQGSPAAHLVLLESARSLLKQMTVDHRIHNSAAPVLFYPDLHMRNLFVFQDNPSAITGIIDWQSTSVEPMFWYLDKNPDFATGSEFCTKAFKLSSRLITPRLSGPRLMDKSFFRPFCYCYRTWKDSVVVLRHEMIKTARLWKALELKEELVNHTKEYQLFEAAQNLRTDLCSLLNTAELLDGMLQAVVSNPDVDDDEPVKDEMTLRAIWPFDFD